MFVYCSNCEYSTDDKSSMQELMAEILFEGGDLDMGECPECHQHKLKID